MERLVHPFVFIEWMWDVIRRRRNRGSLPGVQYSMKYWGLLAAKLIAAGAVFAFVRLMLVKFLPRPEPLFHVVDEPFGHNLGYTFLMMGFFWIAAGIVWAILWD